MKIYLLCTVKTMIYYIAIHHLFEHQLLILYATHVDL